jgi:asparagine synthase (glutamine-hydrolysing)
MAFLTAPFPLTMFRGVFKLEPGHFLRVSSSGVVSKSQYWDLPIDSDEERWRVRPFERIADSLELATQSQMIADVPSGGFLSGGIDSSAICHFMSKHKDELDTYFIAFRPEDMKHDVLMDEGPFAQEMAQAMGANHHATYADTSGLDELLPRLVWHLDEPIGDPAALASYLVSKQASETLTVLLSGVGGDEIFAGYPRYLAMAYMNRFQQLPRHVRQIAIKLGHVLPGGKAAVMRNYKKFMDSAVDDPLDAYLRMLTYFGPKEQRELFTRDFWEAYGRADIYRFHRRLLERHRQEPLLNQIQYLDFKTFLPCLNLMYTDKMSMAASIEVRVPFLDEDFVAEMFTLPARFKLRGRIRKYALKRAMEPRLPKSVVWRRKAGFGSPIHAWIRGRMRDFIEAYLGESRLAEQGIFNPRYVRRLLDQELSNQQYLSNHIWQLLTFQLWNERFVECSSYSKAG